MYIRLYDTLIHVYEARKRERLGIFIDLDYYHRQWVATVWDDTIVTTILYFVEACVWVAQRMCPNHVRLINNGESPAICMHTRGVAGESGFSADDVQGGD